MKKTNLGILCALFIIFGCLQFCKKEETTPTPTPTPTPNSSSTLLSGYFSDDYSSTGGRYNAKLGDNNGYEGVTFVTKGSNDQDTIGYTNAKGMFKYKKGVVVVFYIGGASTGLKLGQKLVILLLRQQKFHLQQMLL